LVRKGLWGLKALILRFPVPRGLPVRLDLRGRKESKAYKARWGLKVRRVHKDRRVFKGFKVRWGRKALKESREPKVFRAFKATMEKAFQ
jgi:hypothetical protein